MEEEVNIDDEQPQATSSTAKRPRDPTDTIDDEAHPRETKQVKVMDDAGGDAPATESENPAASLHDIRERALAAAEQTQREQEDRQAQRSRGGGDHSHDRSHGRNDRNDYRDNSSRRQVFTDNDRTDSDVRQRSNQAQRSRDNRAKIEEKTEIFEMKCKEGVVLTDYDISHPDLASVTVADAARMRDAGYCEADKIDKLWGQKNRMDALFDAGNGMLYYQCRDDQYPQDRRGGQKFKNRAGDKLWEVKEAIDLFDDAPAESGFLDVCGGPGAFSELLLSRQIKSKLSHGWGITLKPSPNNKTDDWYPFLRREKRFTVTYGQDDTGDVYVPENLQHVVKDVSATNISIVVADGGFKIPKIGEQHMENLQELFSGRIILSEFLYMFKTLQPGGTFVCKLFDTFSHLTVSLIYASTLLFEEVFVVKPRRSRIVNSERYFAAKRLKAPTANYHKIVTIMENLHKRLYDDEKGKEVSPLEYVSPNSIIPMETILSDEVFMGLMNRMNADLAMKQTLAIQSVMDQVDKELAYKQEKEDLAVKAGARQERFGTQ